MTMSVDDENVSETNLEKLVEITNKLNRCNKNVKIILEMIEKMNLANESKKEYKPMDEATYKNKRAVYLTKLNNKEIKNPKKETLEYYKVDFDKETETYS